MLTLYKSQGFGPGLGKSTSEGGGGGCDIKSTWGGGGWHKVYCSWLKSAWNCLRAINSRGSTGAFFPQAVKRRGESWSGRFEKPFAFQSNSLMTVLSSFFVRSLLLWCKNESGIITNKPYRQQHPLPGPLCYNHLQLPYHQGHARRNRLIFEALNVKIWYQQNSQNIYN